MSEDIPRVGIVGPCTSGKTTLISKMAGLPIKLHHIAQEHSFAPSMWQKIAKPNILIFLDVTFEASQKRKRLNWNQDEYQEQQRRLQHARAHANLYIQTDNLSPEQVYQQVIDYLKNIQLLKS